MKLTQIFIFSTLLLSTMAYSQDGNMSMCEKEAERFGNGLGRDHIPFECVDVMKQAASAAAVKSSSDGKILAYGHRNIVFIKQNEKIRVIAGSYTELEDILSIAIDEVNQEVAVLDQKGDVRFYSSYITGNVAPLRVIKHKNLEGAVDLVINTKSNEVIVLNKAQRSLLFFSRLANYHAPEKIKRMNVVRKISNLKSFERVSLDIEEQTVMTSDAKKKNQQGYSLKK
jgi:hypothetical protein